MLLIGYVLVLEISQTVWKAFCQHEDYGKGGNFKEAKSFFPKEKKGGGDFFLVENPVRVPYNFARSLRDPSNISTKQLIRLRLALVHLKVIW